MKSIPKKIIAALILFGSCGCAHGPVVQGNAPIILATLLAGGIGGALGNQNHFEKKTEPLDPSIKPFYHDNLTSGDLESHLKNFFISSCETGRPLYITMQQYRNDKGQWPSNKEQLVEYSITKSTGVPAIDWAEYQNIVTTPTADGNATYHYEAYMFWGSQPNNYAKINFNGVVVATAAPKNCEDMFPATSTNTTRSTAIEKLTKPIP